MSLSGSQVKLLQDALISAFDEQSLTQMVRVCLDQSLAAVAGGSNLSEIVFNLIIWAERFGRTNDLITGAATQNPCNPQLSIFIAQYFGAGTVYPSGGVSDSLRAIPIDPASKIGGRSAHNLDPLGGDKHTAQLADHVTFAALDEAYLTAQTEHISRSTTEAQRNTSIAVQQVLSETDIQDQKNRRVLRQMVKEYWIEGLLDHSLDHEAAIRLGISDKSSLVDNRPWRVIPPRADQTALTLPAGTTFIDVFDQMNQRMLILGEPGAGKTTALLGLAGELVKRGGRNADPTHACGVQSVLVDTAQSTFG